MEGFCVGEPWNYRAIEDGIGFTVITTQQIWRDHLKKFAPLLKNSRNAIQERSRQS